MADQLSCQLIRTGSEWLIRPQTQSSARHPGLPEAIRSRQTLEFGGEPFPQPTIAFTTQLMNHPGFEGR